MTNAVPANSVDHFLQRLVPGYPASGDPRLGEARKRIINPIFAYLFHRISSKQMIAAIGAWANYPESEEFRVQLSGAGFLAKNLKVFVYYWIRERKKIIHWLDHPADAEICEWLDPELVQWVADSCQHDGVPFVALTLERFDFLINHVIEETSKLPTEHAPHQYRWVIQSQPVEASDIVRALQERGIQALYKTYPKVCSTNHAICIVGLAMKHYGMNLFHYFSSDQRQALLKEDHGMVSVKSIKAMAKVERAVEVPPCTIIHADGLRVEIPGNAVDEWRISRLMRSTPLKVEYQEDEEGNKVEVPEAEADFRARCAVSAGKVKVEGDSSHDSFGARMDPSAMDFLASQEDRIERIHNCMTVDAIMKSVSDSQKYKLLELLTGEYSEEFTEYLRGKGVLRDNQDNDEWQERAPVSSQVRHAAAFLKMGEKQAKAFLGELREQHSTVH